jgi:hypothetical protein
MTKIVPIFGLVLLSMSALAQEPSWPPLPDKGFISGRAATKQDIANGNAVFVAAVGDTVIGKPLQIAIPQYAYWKDSAGQQHRVIIVQAEEARGIRIIGFRDRAGKDGTATLPEFTLLGTTPPH